MPRRVVIGAGFRPDLFEPLGSRLETKMTEMLPVDPEASAS